MRHYNYQDTFKTIYNKSLELFRAGNTDKNTWFDQNERSFIAANGWRLQDFFDYAEDQDREDAPSYEIAQSIEQVRRDYFLHVQDGVASPERVEPASLPSKTASLEGIDWLPRIIAKAIGKLKGELADEIMYGCGGDRHFLQSHEIHPAEFLRLVWANTDEPLKIAAFVKKRSPLSLS